VSAASVSSRGGRSSWIPSFNPVVASITLRAVFGRKRAFVFVLPPLVLIAITGALKASHPASGAQWPGHVLGNFGFSVILPLTALIIGTSVLGAEIDDGSIVHLLATPVRRSSVIASKFTVAVVLTMLFAAVPELIAGVIASGTAGRFAIGVFVGALAGSVIYNAVFVMVSVLTTRAIAVGLLYVLVWEVVLGNFVSGARVLSVEQYSLGVANSIARDSALSATLNLRTALIMGVIVTAVTLVIATRRLSQFSLKGDAV
jgi:ABC-2 type transport system permease protein